jgi:hypothetical protein
MKKIDLAKEKVDDRQEITRPDVLRVIGHKNGPGLTWSMGRARLTHILLNGSSSDLDIQLEEFAMNAFCSPQSIILSHLLNQVDRVNGQPGTTAIAARFELPEEMEALAMPAEERAGLDNEERILPVFDATSEQNKPEAIRWSETRPSDLAVEYSELLPKQSILSNELSSGSRKIRRGGECIRIAGGSGEM